MVYHAPYVLKSPFPKVGLKGRRIALRIMGTYFNADEIFEMAEQIERNGAKF